MTNNTLLYLDRAQVEALCSEVDPVDAVRKALLSHAEGKTILPDEAYLGWTNLDGETLRSLNMPSFIGGESLVVGTKIINANPANIKHDLPRADGVTLLFSARTGQIKCIMEGAYISSLRTASVSVMAAEIFSNKLPESLCLIGAGMQAATHLRLFLKRFPSLKNVFLYDVDQKRAEKMAGEFQGPVRITVASTAQEAVESSPLVIPVTTVTAGYIKYDWLQPGTVLINVSLDDALPDVAFKADKLIVDDWNLVKADHRRLLGRLYREGKIVGPYDNAKVGARKVDAELGVVMLNNYRMRSCNSDIIFVNPFGMSINDIAVAGRVFEQARLVNVGHKLPR